MAEVAPCEDPARHHMDAVRRVYQARSSQDYVNSMDAYYFRDVFRRDLFRLLQRKGLLTILRTGRVLDVGCGTAWPARVLLEFGMDPARYCGVDFVDARLQTAHYLCPTMNLVNANGLTLPFATASFDLVLTFQVFSSIHEPEARRRLGEQLMRVLSMEGYLVYWDVIPEHSLFRWLRRLAGILQRGMHVDDQSERTPWIRAISRSQVNEAFAGTGVTASWVTTGLTRDVARRLLPVSFIACDLVRRLPVLRSYALCLIRKSYAQ